MSTEELDGRTRRAAVMREERRAQILDAALEVFATKGYHGASITDLVQAAGVARGTFYLYFDSKQAIFHELLEDLLVRLRAGVKGIDPASDPATWAEQLVGTVVRILETVAENRALCTILLKEAVGVDEDADARLDAFYGNLLMFIEASLRMGQAVGFVREMDTEIAANCVLGSLKQVLYQYLVVDDERTFDTEAVAREILAFNLRGVASA